jgi:hypothetical protein
LTNCSIDAIVGSEYGPFDEARRAFLSAMGDEILINTAQAAHDVLLARTMQDSWVSKAVWFWACIRSLDGWHFLFEDHLVPKFCTSNENLISDLKDTSAFWVQNVDAVVKAKVEQEKNYQDELRALFASRASPEDTPRSTARRLSLRTPPMTPPPRALPSRTLPPITPPLRSPPPMTTPLWTPPLRSPPPMTPPPRAPPRS